MGLEFFTAGPLRTLLRVAGVDVTYRRGELSCPYRLIPADQENAAAGENGYTRQWSERDWIGVQADLVLDSELILPQSGDEIVIAGEGDLTAECWQVAASLNGQCWEPLAGNRSGLKLHTVRIS